VVKFGCGRSGRESRRAGAMAGELIGRQITGNGNAVFTVLINTW
jgi:hypothetical protein